MDYIDLLNQVFPNKECFETIKPRNDSDCQFCPLTHDTVEYDGRTYKVGTRILNEDGIPVCVTCGRTDWEFVSDEPEWRGNADGEGPDMCRVGAPVDLTLYSAEWGSGTRISTKNASYAMKRLARISFHTSMNHKDRSLYHAYEDLDRAGQTLGLPQSIMLDAKIMYRKFNEEKLTRGAVRTGIKANCIARACTNADITRTTQEIAAAFNIPQRDISRTTDIFRETIPDAVSTSAASVVTKPSDLVPRFVSQVACIPQAERWRVRQKVVQACLEHEKCPRLMGKTPKGVASAVLYLTLVELGYEANKEEIRQICDVSLPTLNKIEKLIASGGGRR